MMDRRSVVSSSDRDGLIELVGDQVRFDEPMSRHTTLRIGGPADAWITPTSLEQLQRVICFCLERKLPMTAVGGGSNLLVRDGGIRGVVLATRALRHLSKEGDTRIRVESGLSTGKLLSCAMSFGLGGVEFLGGVPGSVGGGLIMNAGTYLGEFKDVTKQVTSVRLDNGAVVTRTNAQCGFRYRGSDLPATEIVAEAVLELFGRDTELIRADVLALRQQRKEREPHKVHNAGSIFKNPAGDYAGRLIESAELKGTRIGNAECSQVHANWLVNLGGATARDLLALIDLVRNQVAKRHKVDLDLEVRVIGEDS